MARRAFSIGIEFPVQLPVSPAVAAAVKRLGIDQINYCCASFPARAAQEDSRAIIAVSDSTLAAIRRCVEEGATVIAWGPLAHKCGLADWTSDTRRVAAGKGQIVATDDFSCIDAARYAGDLVGRWDEVRYRFRGTPGHEAVLRRGATDNDVTVELT